MSKGYVKKSAEERRKEIEALTKDMDKRVEQHFHSTEDLKEYLSFMGKFHQYSLSNTQLIQQQFMGAQAVGSFAFWKEKGFSVNKGEKGIKILVPNKTVPKFQDENGNPLIKLRLKKGSSYRMEKKRSHRADCTFQSVMCLR